MFRFNVSRSVIMFGHILSFRTTVIIATRESIGVSNARWCMCALLCAFVSGELM